MNAAAVLLSSSPSGGLQDNNDASSANDDDAYDDDSCSSRSCYSENERDNGDDDDIIDNHDLTTARDDDNNNNNNNNVELIQNDDEARRKAYKRHRRMERNRKIQKLFRAIERNDPTVTTVSAVTRQSTGTMTLGEALLGTRCMYNTHISTLEISLGQVLSPPNNLRAIQYVYDFIRTSDTLRNVKLVGFFDPPKTLQFTEALQQSYMSRLCRAISYNPFLLEVRFHMVYNPRIPISTITQLLQNAPNLKVLVLNRVAFRGDVANEFYDDNYRVPPDCLSALAEAVSCHRKLERFKIRYYNFHMTDFIRELLGGVSRNAATSALRNLEIYTGTVCPGMYSDFTIASPSMDSTILAFLSSMKLRHLGLSYCFSTKESMESFLTGLKIAANKGSNSTLFRKLTLDRCEFCFKATQLLFQGFKNRSNMRMPELCWSDLEYTTFGYYKKKPTQVVAKLLEGYSTIRALELQFDYRYSAFHMGNFDDFFNTMWKQVKVTTTIKPKQRGSQRPYHCCPLERLRLTDLREKDMLNMARSLPHLVHLQEFWLDCPLVANDPRPIIEAIRSNGSLRSVKLYFWFGYPGVPESDELYCKCVKLIQSICFRNHWLPVLLGQQPPSYRRLDIVPIKCYQNCCGTKSNGNNKTKNVCLPLFPSLFRASQQAPRMAPTRLLSGLLTLGNSIGRDNLSLTRRVLPQNEPRLQQPPKRPRIE